MLNSPAMETLAKSPVSLVEFAARKVVTDLKLLKQAPVLPCVLLDKLVQTCYREPKKVLALRELIRHWPRKIFSFKNMDLVPTAQDIVLVASLLQIRQMGSIECFDISSDMGYRVGGELATNVLLKAAMGKPVSTMEYEPMQTRSYMESLRNVAVSVSKFSKCFPDQREGISYLEEDSFSSRYSEEPRSCKIFMDMVINDDNFDEARDVLTEQRNNKELLSNNRSRVFLYPVIFRAYYLDVRRIGTVLDLIDEKYLVGLDLEYCCLVEGSRLPYLQKHAERFYALRKLNLAYNMLTHASGTVLLGWLKNLQYLEHLDLSHNRIGDALNMILKEGLVSSNMTSLILTEVGLTRSALSLILNVQISGILRH